jgi:predicted TIM-barrel fold metal-dependent hydrolase
MPHSGPPGKPRLSICDAQVHAPDLPSKVHVPGLNPDDLLREMAVAGVDRCIIVPLAAAGGDVGANNGSALEMARRYPGRFAVMGRFEVTTPDQAGRLDQWTSQAGLLGLRLSFTKEPESTLFRNDRLDWLWSAAQRNEIPVMILVPNELVYKAGEIAARYPELKLVVDHLGLTPYVVYDDLFPAIAPLVRLASFPNVAVKATALPDSVAEPFPFPSLHEPLRRVLEAFGSRRLFWGSDLTRLKCPYGECVRLFTDELPFLSGEDKEWVMGRGVMEWLRWDPPALAG